jgi:acetyl esterase
MVTQGRLRDPSMSLRTDPRTHPKLIPALEPFNMDANVPPAPPATTLAEVHDFMRTVNDGIETFYSLIPTDRPTDSSLPEVVYRPMECVGQDGNTIKLYVYRPAESEGSDKQALPCVVYIHGGGMVFSPTVNKNYIAWAKSLAATGMIAICVDFRNAWNKEGGWNHFPDGLNDCAAAVRWINDNRKRLGISKIILQGESGGGNLSIATALKANREGWIDAVDGVYAISPYVSGAPAWEEDRVLKEFPSLVENNGYILDRSTMALYIKAYDPEGKNATNPLAWPYHAEEKDLKGLPPFTITVDELDPLRDEGMAFWRKLVKAGVRAVGKMNLGLGHANAPTFRVDLSAEYDAVVGDIKRFSETL